MREKELRLALVCYGGVSLAIYMHGITKEVWKLVRASAARNRGEAPAGDTEIVYHALLEAIGPHLDLRVIVDIVAGASAGGINGILLAHAIAGGHDMEPLRTLWLDGADVDALLDPAAAAARSWSKWWATPLVWYARSKGYGMADDVVDPAARIEVRAKLSRFMRSRWFRPPFSGVGFTGMLYDALGAMAAGTPGPPLIPPGLPLDLFVTVTDFNGRPERLALHSPAAIVETEHRLVIDFHGASGGIGDPAELAFAARATASFPGAFPPTRIAEIDTVLAGRGAAWPGRAAFLARIFPRRAMRGQPFDHATLIDGSVLNNRPFGPAIEALRHRPAHREVDRRFVYIDPKPGLRPDREAETVPGFFTTILRALADIPREQPIRDNLEAIAALSARVRRLRQVVDGMTPRSTRRSSRRSARASSCCRSIRGGCRTGARGRRRWRRARRGSPMPPMAGSSWRRSPTAPRRGWRALRRRPSPKSPGSPPDASPISPRSSSRSRTRPSAAARGPPMSGSSGASTSTSASGGCASCCGGSTC